MNSMVGKCFSYELILISAALLAAACTPQTGEVMLVVQSDMELPKDVDTLRIEVSALGKPAAYEYDHQHLGEPSRQTIQLPATIGILPSEDDPSLPITVRVLGKRGGYSGLVRVLNEITTTIPSDRIATLQMPVQFLCMDRIGTSKECQPGTRCVGGACVPSGVDATSLPDYSEPEVFGEGSCLSVAACFDNPTLHEAFIDENDGGKCKVNLGHPIAEDAPSNIAVLTDYKGMCNNFGCFVALDAGRSDAGWKILDANEGIIEVAPGICDAGLRDMVRGIAETKATAECPQKTIELPTCGPWSTAGLGTLPTGNTAVPRGSGLHRPSAVVFGKVSYPPQDLRPDEEFLYWSSAGLFSKDAMGVLSQVSPGAVHSAQLEPFQPQGTPVSENPILLDPHLIAFENKFTMRDAAFSGGYLYWTAAGSDQTTKGKIQFAEFGGAGATVTPFDLSTTSPEGIAAANGRLAWTDFNTGDIMLTSIGMKGAPAPAPLPWIDQTPDTHPYRIALDDKYACWTNEGAPAKSNGSVVCSSVAAPLPMTVKDMLETPRAITISGNDLYFATFGSMGQVFRATRVNGIFETPVPIASNQSYPNGIAADGTYVYWTNWGDGTVHRMAADGSGMPELLAENQHNPGAVAVLRRSDQQTIVAWVNEGSLAELSSGSSQAKVADGMVMQLVLNSP